MENIPDIILKVLAVSGAAAWIAAFLTNKRGENKALDFILDVIELIAGNINKAKNAPEE
jgi:H+/gluconate symporter-like permease